MAPKYGTCIAVDLAKGFDRSFYSTIGTPKPYTVRVRHVYLFV